MKKQIIFSLLILLVLINTMKAQQWLLTGNTGTTPGTNYIGTTDNKDIIFKTSPLSTDERMRILGTSGFIGIGITTPFYRLHINNGGVKIGNLTDATSRANNVLRFGDGDYVKIGELEADDRLSFSASGGYNFMGTGYVTFNHYVKLAPGKWLMIGGGAEDMPRLNFNGGGTHAYIDYMDNLNFRANKNWISSLILFGNGSVGVGFGTTYNAGDYRNMGYKLAVNGGIICEEVKVIGDVPDADYVFDPDYDIRTITELEDFVVKNKHLPNIPSAEEFKKDGYSVGDMDEMLLRKVEELTLYVIELEKKYKDLESKVTTTPTK